MESISVEVSKLPALPQSSQSLEKTISDFMVKKYIMPELPINTYRIFYKDNSFEDVEADNAAEAKNIASRKDIAKIIMFKLCYPEILLRNQHVIIQKNNALILIKTNQQEYFCELIPEQENIFFEELTLENYSRSSCNNK